MAARASRDDVWRARNSIIEMTTRLLGPGFHNFDLRNKKKYLNSQNHYLSKHAKVRTPN